MATLLDTKANLPEQTCAVCLETINKHSVTLECAHRYCKDCIDTLISSALNNNCPMCRVTIDINKCIYSDTTYSDSTYSDTTCSDSTLTENEKFLKAMEYIKTSGEYNLHKNYIHFDTKSLCDEFIKKAKKQRISIGKRCCDGTGCKLNNLTIEQVKKLKKNYSESNTININ